MTRKDRRILRDLARRVAEIAAWPVQEEKRRLWYAQNALRPVRPLVFCSPEGSWVELLPEESLECEAGETREIELALRQRIYAAEHFHDDQVCDRIWNVQPAVAATDWGMGPEYTHSDTPRGSYVWEGPIKTRGDVEKLRTPTVTADPRATEERAARHQDLLGDILEVEVHGSFWWTLGLIDEWTALRGLNQTLLDMSDDPELVHAGMRRLMEGRLEWLGSLEAQGLLGLNNGNHYVGSGGFGFTGELPSDGFAGQVRTKDMWGFCEAQALSLVSPTMHEEFVLRYQLPILERFGLNCYGCCEPLHLKLAMLRRQAPRLRRVSISPWADKRRSAEILRGEAVYSWKPNPAYVAAGEFDGGLVRRDVRETVEIAKEHGCALEIILKDTHTCSHQPWRFDEWTRIAMEEVQA
jgi:hypothetical protein